MGVQTVKESQERGVKWLWLCRPLSASASLSSSLSSGSLVSILYSPSTLCLSHGLFREEASAGKRHKTKDGEGGSCLSHASFAKGRLSTTHRSDWPCHFDTRSDDDTEMKVEPSASVATALARYDLPEMEGVHKVLVKLLHGRPSHGHRVRLRYAIFSDIYEPKTKDVTKRTD